MSFSPRLSSESLSPIGVNSTAPESAQQGMHTADSGGISTIRHGIGSAGRAGAGAVAFRGAQDEGSQVGILEEQFVRGCLVHHCGP